MTLTFHTNPMSRGRFVRWMLEEVGQPYDTILLNYPKMQEAAFRAINPMGKVPVILHDDTVVTETAAIIAYLADAFPEAALAPPPGSVERGPYYRWLFFAAGPLEAAVTNKAFGVEVPEGKRGFAGYGSYGLTLDMLEAAVVGNGWLAGGHFSAADLYVASHLMFGLRFGTVERREAFVSFVARATDREAYRRATAIDDALMPSEKRGA